MTPRNSVPTIGILTERLTAIASATGCEAKQVTLTAVSTASLLLGLGPGYRPMLQSIAHHDDPIDLVTMQWRWWVQSFPYLGGHLGPITGWLTQPRREQAHVLRRQLEHLSTIDLPAVAERTEVAGDLLGQVLTELNAPGDKSARGAFYTPTALAQLLAQIGGATDTCPGDSIHEPCVGGGGLVISAVRALRAAGHAPELRRWVLQDIDPYAVAVAGIAMSIHGIPQVELRCGDTLATSAPMPWTKTA